jgi:ABC-type bacteriocin/lantibiotic exporter with double-glycine peptidase domain
MGWKTKTVAHHTFDVLLQEQEADCGLCCVAMVVNLKGQGKPTSALVRQELPKGAYQPSTMDRTGFQPTPLSMAVQPTAHHSDGTYLRDLQQALTKWGIQSTYKGGGARVQDAIIDAQAGEPIICHVTWQGGGGHWVVITHAQGASHFVLDPDSGLWVNNSPITYDRLEWTAGAAAKVTYGTWTGEWLKITR